jgi:Ecdysteroid kinase-like family
MLFSRVSCTDLQKYLIVKRQIPSRSRRELFRCDAAFGNEIAAYCQLIPILKKFSRIELPLPECIFAGVDDDGGEIVVLEDLTEVGYGMADRFKGLDYLQCSVVMKVKSIFWLFD